jgi:acetyl esterase
MAVDPQVQALLDAMASQPPIRTLSVSDARAMFKAHPLPGVKASKVAAAADRTIPGPGGPLRLRVYTPNGIRPFPLLVFFHGGGWVVCDLDTHDAFCRNLCAGAGCVVVSVDYRLAPEHRFPAATDDCLAATQWCTANAVDLGADPACVVVGGDSAGGTLAAVTALRVRDEGGPRLLGQLLIYPMADLGLPETPSFADCAEGFGLAAADLPWFLDRYLNDLSEAWHPHASPMHAASLRGLPPALVVTAEYDPLRDDGEQYAARLREAGVPTVVQRFDGMIHAFLLFSGLVNKADEALEETYTWLRGAFWGAAL